MPRIDAADLVLVALRKAALLSHWIPGLGLRIEQPGRPGLRVAAWPDDTASTDIEFHPCEFRGLVLQRMQADLVALARLIATDGAALRIGHITAAGTAIGHQGLVRHELDEANAVLAFATLLDVSALTRVGLAAGAHPGEQQRRAGRLQPRRGSPGHDGAQHLHDGLLGLREPGARGGPRPGDDLRGRGGRPGRDRLAGGRLRLAATSAPIRRRFAGHEVRHQPTENGRLGAHFAPRAAFATESISNRWRWGRARNRQGWPAMAFDSGDGKRGRIRRPANQAVSRSATVSTA